MIPIERVAMHRTESLSMLAISLLSLFGAYASASVPVMPSDVMADPAAVISAAKSVTAARYPDADTVTVDDRVYIRYEPDGTSDTWDDEWIKVLTEKGRRSCATLSLDYNERWGDAEIERVEIVGTNGVIRSVDFKRTMKVATDNSSMAINIVDPMKKRMSCAVPGLAVGEIRHVVFRRGGTKARMKDAWADAYSMEYTAPIISTIIYVDQPAARPLAKAMVRNPYKDTVVRLPDCRLPDGYTRVAWKASNVPQVFPEPDMPPLSRCAQTLRLSTVKDWETVSRWYWSISAPHLERTTPAMTNMVEYLVENCKDDESKTRAIFKFVSQEIRYMGLTLEDGSPGYEPHDVDITFDSRYGVCRDKAALLTALLRIAGIPAYPVLIHAGTKMDPEIPLPYFNHAIVAVAKKSGGYELMDPTDESTRDLFPSYLSNKSYIVARPDGDTLRTSPVPSVDNNRIEVDATANLSNDDILYSATIRFGGINDNAFRSSFLKKKPVERRRQFEGFLRRMASGAELLSLDIEPVDLSDTETPLSAKVVGKLPSRVLKGNTQNMLSLPLFTRNLNLADMILDGSTSLETRRFPLMLSSTCGSEERLSLTLDDSLGTLCSIPPDAVVTNVAGYSFARTVKLDGPKIEVRRRLDLSAVEFEVEDYYNLRNARKDVESAEREKPVFARDSAGNANVRTILTSAVRHFRSPKSWVSTNVIEKEVLTYRGKKTTAELELSFAPSTRSVELLYATVSNKNGKVYTATPREINLMDCGWAASAPRYPASKQLVVNLPGVEIGSVVRYSWVVDVTNAPVAYSSHTTFDSVQPIDCSKLEYHVPDGMRFLCVTNCASLAAPVLSGGVSHSQDGETVYTWRADKPRLLPDEPALPYAELWRKVVSVSAADWDSYGSEFSSALADARALGSDAVRQAARDCAVTAKTPAEKITAVRTYLAHHVRMSGPGLFELPFDSAFSAPDRALADGYASYGDYMNLIYTMLDELGFDCSFVLADDVTHGIQYRVDLRCDVPSPEWFDVLLVRAEHRVGGFPGIFGFFAFGGESEVFHIGRENEFTPPEASSHVGERFFDPESISFGEVPAFAEGAGKWDTFADNRCLMTVRENGSVDFDIQNFIYGSGVGGYRKRFEEMLPEMRSRFYQQLVGNIAQNATATKELVTDTESYPAETTFSAYVERFAVVQNGTISLALPDFTTMPFGVSGSTRTTPFIIGSKTPVEDVYEVVFPKGWTRVECLPETFRFEDPSGREKDWVLVHEAKSRIAEDGLLHVTVRRFIKRSRALMYSADYFPMFREWNRRAASPAARTIVIGR